MKKRIGIAIALMTFSAWAQEQEETIIESSCSLSVKTTVLPNDSLDNTGQVMIDASLTDKNGKPIADQEIRMISTNGMLTCMPPTGFSHAEVESNVEGCLKTQEDGTIKIYLVDIPFNKPGRVNAYCTYGNIKVSASSTYSITKKIIKIGKRKAKKKSS